MPATAWIPSWPHRWWLVGIACFLVALFVGFELVRPFTAGAVGFDSASSVTHFDRIAAGRHLESFTSATPKPFLTLVYGLLYALTGDWRSISWATIGAFAACVVLGGWFAWRIAGPIAAAFAFVALLGSRTLLADVAIAYAVPWALVWCLTAGLVATSKRPRPAVAGVMLAVAALARLEVLVIVGVAVVAVAVSCRPLRRSAPPESLRWWLVALGMLALPVMFIHDWLLTGDPLFWISVSQRYSEASPASVMTPDQLGGAVFERYAGMLVLTVLALVGFVALFRRRQWVPLVGLIASSVGIAAFLGLLALRGIYVSSRYFAGVDVALIFAAAVGAAAVVEAASRPFARNAASRLVAMTAGVALAVASIWPVASLSATFRAQVETQQRLAQNADRVLPAVAGELSSIPGAGTFPAADAPMSDDPADLILLVPPLEGPRFAVDLDLPLTQVGTVTPVALVPGAGFIPHGDVIVHDTLVERRDAYDRLKIDRPTQYGTVTLEPVLADPANGVWVLRIVR